MRIVAGEYRGRAIRAPKGRETRPTTDRVRESIMSAVESRVGGFEGKAVLDVFAGSGAFGIEALSRGALHACFTDAAPDAISAIKSNTSSLNIPPSKYSITRCDVCKSGIRNSGNRADIVFLDPPYAMKAEEVVGLITDSQERGLLSEECVIVYEHDLENSEGALEAIEASGLVHSGRKKYGNTQVDYIGLP